MNIFILRTLIATLTLLCAVCSPTVAQAQSSQPNIIFILVDDLGWGDLGVFYQNSRSQDRKHATPNLDQFAAEGMQLRQHYCPAPVCAPSRASLLSGRHQGHEPIRDNQFDKALADSHTLGTVLQTAGYRTAMVGKYGLPGGDRELYDMAQWVAYPTKRGFDEFFGYVKHRDGHTQYPGNDYPRGDSELHRTGKPVFHNEQKLEEELAGCYTTDLYTAFAKKWIVEHRQDHPKQPFFLYLAHSTPHAALHTPSTPYPKGGGLQGGIQWIGEPGRMINTAGKPIDSWIHPDYADKDWMEQEKRFATMVRRIDSSVADILHTLRDLGIDQETIIVFTSDNGPHKESYIEGFTYNANSFDSFGPFNGIKRDVLEGGIRMPTLVRWPGQIPAGALNQTPSQFHDWLPTFAGLAGVPGPALSDGVSLLPYLTGQGTVRESSVYVEYFNGQDTPTYEEFDPRHQGRPRNQMQVVFVDGFKGIRTDIQSHEDDFEIYDLVKDGRESTDLSGSNDYFTTLQQRMKDRVLQMRRPNKSAPRPYDDAYVPGVDPALQDRKVSWAVYQGNFPWVPQTFDLKPVKRGTSQKVDLNVLTRDYNVVVEYKGFATIRTSGEYTFQADSDGGAILRVHDAVVVDNESVIDGKRQTKGKILLQKGVHPYTLTYLRGTEGKAKLKFSYSK
ncbi:MAG: sulfatase-like hydrolase/transferase [Verrucomicrobia bacterium]|nr:sulfatase-like hydrolase/transferase [Verrucomicrobiota bacterium]